MKAIVMLASFFLSSILFAQDFRGCGDYLFRGVLKEDKYIVNEGTKSEMVFELIDNEDFLKLSAFLNMPSSFKGSIIKKMDGTKGVVKGSTEIFRRFPNPLNPKDTGITLIKKSVCD
jgi:hypothetical protein